MTNFELIENTKKIHDEIKHNMLRGINLMRDGVRAATEGFLIAKQIQDEGVVDRPLAKWVNPEDGKQVLDKVNRQFDKLDSKVAEINNLFGDVECTPTP